MADHDLPTSPSTGREPYEMPRVLEDLPLESFSLACDPGKSDFQCEADGGIVQS
ncbi:MAG: hypothetical protein U0324_25485 [Polyangiales bacterium]